MGTSELTTIGGSDLAASAEKLRQVKLATRRFLALWALTNAREGLRRPPSGPCAAEAALAHFVKHEWTSLYEYCDIDDG